MSETKCLFIDLAAMRAHVEECTVCKRESLIALAVDILLGAPSSSLQIDHRANIVVINRNDSPAQTSRPESPTLIAGTICRLHLTGLTVSFK